MALAILLGLPSLGQGIAADDLIHRLILLGVWPFPVEPDPIMHLFSFIPGSTLGTEVLRDLGFLSWTADPEISATFFRPVSAVTHVLDYQLWPNVFWLQHLHSLLWYAASCGGAYLCFRQFGVALPLAAFAGLMFTVEDAHGLNVGWLANRNASVCLVFGVASMCLHHRWRQESRWPLIVASVLCFILAMFSAEAGIGALAYIAAWELVMEERSWPRRLLGLLPYGVALLGWLIIYKHLGHGVQWSDIYVDPGTQPGRFLLACFERLPMMMAAQWLQIPIDLSNALTLPQRVAFSGLCWVITALISRWIWSLLKDRKEARFWALGMFLSFIPLCAAFPMSRVLTFSGLGAFALIAIKLGDWVNGIAEPSRFQRLLFWIHVPCAAALLVAAPLAWFGMLSVMMPTEQLPRDLTPKDTLIVMQSHELASASLSLRPLIDGHTEGPIPVAILSSVFSEMSVTRVAMNALEIRIADGWNRLPVDRLTRSIDRPWRQGDTVSRPGYRVQVIELTDDGRPRVARFTFKKPLEDPKHRWFTFKDLDFVEWSPPPMGETTQLFPIHSQFF